MRMIRLLGIGITLSVAAVALILTVAGCGVRLIASEMGGRTVVFDSVPWRDGEMSSYETIDGQGRTTGTATIGLIREGRIWRLTEVERAANRDQEVKVRVEAASLRPLSGEKNLLNENGRTTLTTVYGAGQVRIDGLVDGGSVGRSLDVPEGVLDSDQLVPTLRALPFAEGYEGSAVVVFAQSGTVMDVALQVKGREKVRVPIGSLDTWLVELTVDHTVQRAWYEVSEPHRLAKYDDGTTTFVLTGLVE